MNTLKQFGSTLQGSFWFLPTLIVAFSIALAVGLIEADSVGSREPDGRLAPLYEEVLIARVHPEILRNQGSPPV